MQSTARSATGETSHSCLQYISVSLYPGLNWKSCWIYTQACGKTSVPCKFKFRAFFFVFTDKLWNQAYASQFASVLTLTSTAITFLMCLKKKKNHLCSNKDHHDLLMPIPKPTWALVEVCEGCEEESLEPCFSELLCQVSWSTYIAHTSVLQIQHSFSFCVCRISDKWRLR